MRYTLALVLLLVASVSALAAPASLVCPPLPSATMPMTPILASDFEREAVLNAKVWTATTGNPYGDPAAEDQTYAPSQVSIVPGVALRLSTAPAPVGAPKPYLSGGISTLGKWSQLYGRFSAKIKMPHQNGQWPAFWLLPTDNTWPPEIDVVEFIAYPNGKTPTSPLTPPWFGENPATTVHWKSATNANNQATAGVNYGISSTNEFEPWSTLWHTYTVEWTPFVVEWTIDGVQVFCTTDPAAIPNKPMYMILNDAVAHGTIASPGWAGYVPSNAVWPQNMDIDHVNVSQFNAYLPAH